jgi:hypothetical protein
MDEPSWAPDGKEMTSSYRESPPSKLTIFNDFPSHFLVDPEQAEELAI